MLRCMLLVCTLESGVMSQSPTRDQPDAPKLKSKSGSPAPQTKSKQMLCS